MSSRDSVNLESLSIHLLNGLGPSAFNLNPPPSCPIILDISIGLIENSIKLTSKEDSMNGLGVNYSLISKEIYKLISSPLKKFKEPFELIKIISKIILNLNLNDLNKIEIKLKLPKALLHCDLIIYQSIFLKQKQENENENIDEQKERKCEINNLKTECIIGLHPHERLEKQRIELDIKIIKINWNEWNHKDFADEVYNFVNQSSYGTIESLIHDLGSHLFKLPILKENNDSEISITIRKPSAIPFAVPSITIQRSKADYPSSSASGSRNIKGKKQVFVAVGSNIGDRVGNINRAIKQLEANGCQLGQTSRLYESEPMYVEDQDRFINGVIELYTTLQPLELLRLLKRTEKSVGRTKTFTNGPRVIDLDLIFYGEEQVMIGERGDEPDEDGVGWLECPHRSLGEREFVLRPLADIAPDLIHPSTRQTINQLLSRLPKTTPPPLQPIIPFSGSSRPLRLPKPAIPYVMAIFNATPDSFSDGDPARTDVDYAIKAVEKLFEGDDEDNLPDILDIGGMSTRPNSEPCSEEEEIKRVIPLIQAIRKSSNGKLKAIPISIDTYRPNVAKLAVEAGASCVNDVKGGSEPGMMEIMAKLNVPVILMHSRGDSKTMNSNELTDYSKYGGVIEGVKKELENIIEIALFKKGLKKWNIILDPGLGFSKKQNDNLKLIKNLSKLINNNSNLNDYPWLIGASRKGFIGKIINQNIALNRSFGDSALNSFAVNTGLVNILRVHQIRETKDTIKMSVAIRDA